MSKTKKDLSFEEKVKRLEEIVSKIEESDVEYMNKRLTDTMELIKERCEQKSIQFHTNGIQHLSEISTKYNHLPRYDL